jgi:hypothetical protein
MHGPTCIVWANLTPFSLPQCFYDDWQKWDQVQQCGGCEDDPAAPWVDAGFR